VVEEAQEGEGKRLVCSEDEGEAPIYRVEGWPRRTGQVIDGDVATGAQLRGRGCCAIPCITASTTGVMASKMVDGGGRHPHATVLYRGGECR
jgi:hypothetical protein